MLHAEYQLPESDLHHTNVRHQYKTMDTECEPNVVMINQLTNRGMN